jgi:Flp pilus assembly protein TadG
VVEFALVAPLLILTVISSIEIGRALMVTHSLEEAARSACRVAVLRDATQTLIGAEAERILGPVGVKTYSLTTEPISPATAARWTPVTVTVVASFDNMSWLPLPRLFSGKTYRATCTLPKEYSSTN